MAEDKEVQEIDPLWGRRPWQVPQICGELATVVCNGGTALVSLAHDCVIASSFMSPILGVPHVPMSKELWESIQAEAGLPVGYGNGQGIPWPAVFKYLHAHPEVFSRKHDMEIRKLLRQIKAAREK